MCMIEVSIFMVILGKGLIRVVLWVLQVWFNRSNFFDFLLVWRSWSLYEEYPITYIKMIHHFLGELTSFNILFHGMESRPKLLVQWPQVWFWYIFLFILISFGYGCAFFYVPTFLVLGFNEIHEYLLGLLIFLPHRWFRSGAQVY